jgi:hypothetical protein
MATIDTIWSPCLPSLSFISANSCESGGNDVTVGILLVPGCQIFLGTKCKKLGNIHTPKDHKIYQISIKYTKRP